MLAQAEAKMGGAAAVTASGSSERPLRGKAKAKSGRPGDEAVRRQVLFDVNISRP